jgi:hypothetical protein
VAVEFEEEEDEAGGRLCGFVQGALMDKGKFCAAFFFRERSWFLDGLAPRVIISPVHLD